MKSFKISYHEREILFAYLKEEEKNFVECLDICYRKLYGKRKIVNIFQTGAK